MNLMLKIKKMNEFTCFAYAIATTFHLLLFKKEENPPPFEKIKGAIIEDSEKCENRRSLKKVGTSENRTSLKKVGSNLLIHYNHMKLIYLGREQQSLIKDR